MSNNVLTTKYLFELGVDIKRHQMHDSILNIFLQFKMVQTPYVKYNIVSMLNLLIDIGIICQSGNQIQYTLSKYIKNLCEYDKCLACHDYNILFCNGINNYLILQKNTHNTITCII